MEDAFGHWLAGFIDGEGCFLIPPSTGRSGRVGWHCAFKIGVRADEEPILREIVKRTEIGKITAHYQPNKGSPAVEWEVVTKAGCAALVRLLDRYPLRAKKAADYAIWREAVSGWMLKRHNGNQANDWSDMARYAETLKALRAYGGSEPAAIPARPDPQLRLVS